MIDDRRVDRGKFKRLLTVPDELAGILKHPIDTYRASMILRGFTKTDSTLYLSVSTCWAIEELLTSGRIPERAVVDFYRDFPQICQSLLQYLNGDGIKLKPKPPVHDFFAGVGAGGDPRKDNRDFETARWEEE